MPRTVRQFIGSDTAVDRGSLLPPFIDVPSVAVPTGRPHVASHDLATVAVIFEILHRNRFPLYVPRESGEGKEYRAGTNRSSFWPTIVKEIGIY